MKKSINLLVFILFLGSCSVSCASSTVNMSNFTFDPTIVTINAGQKVIWVNKDTAPHKLGSDNDKVVSSEIKPGVSYSQTFTKPGTYDYYCTLHPSMKGQVIVK